MLFKRIGKSIRLTAAGVKMLSYAAKLLAIEEEALAEIAEKRIAGLAWSECLETGILMIQHRGRRCSPALEAFMEAARYQVCI